MQSAQLGRVAGRQLRRARYVLQRLITTIDRTLLGTTIAVRTRQPLVALTFDDGPHPLYTPALLDLLATHHAAATFFVIGERAEASPEIMARIVAEGHALANHTWSHQLLPAVPGAVRRRELARCARAIRPYGGTRLMRPPKGHQSFWSRLDIALSRHQPITWNLHAEDWRAHDANWMADQLEAGLAPGSIVLLHDALWDALDPELRDRRPTIAAVDLLLRRTAGQFRFVTLPELLRAGRPIRAAWYRPLQRAANVAETEI